MFGVIGTTLDTVSALSNEEVVFFSVAKTIPFVALIPNEVTPCLTAFKAYSIWTNLPLGEKVVKEKEYLSAMLQLSYLFTEIS
ncbi:hypothetical protein WICMUC_003200 [Wickerhamomyces mucosus]|uniref:Uncharacterized protein n=1 Tax=Wickerhamomyces mucosus TaxID=1378264 RepID=A0A9P8PNX4_9ASCO|nr:hypothetical protein WICMUC_003200 [Wickerhamomyces mucosus]